MKDVAYFVDSPRDPYERARYEIAMQLYRDLGEDSLIRMLPQTKLNPTGRWRIRSGPQCDCSIEIEHKSLFRRKWIHENDVLFSLPVSCVTFECAKP